MTATIKDVAEKAGVSTATVSRVLANKEGFYSERTAQRVRKVATSLGYEKNISAVELVTQKSQVIGVIISSIKTRDCLKTKKFRYNLRKNESRHSDDNT